MSKVAILGLDGATWRNLGAWVREGRLPLFKRLMDQGATGTLLSTNPPFTIPAWNVMTSGKGPAELGCFSTIQKVPAQYSWRPYYLIHDQPAELWDYATRAGLEALVMNFPNVHEPYPIRGAMTAGWLFSDAERTTCPPELKSELDSLVGGYEIDTGDPKLFPGGDGEFLGAVVRVALNQARAATTLLRKRRFPLAMVAFVGTDRAQHRCWFEPERILMLYQRLEEGLGELLSEVGDEYNVFLVSDHGFGPATRRIRLNQWLLDHGYLAVRQSTRRLRGGAVDMLRNVGLEPFLRRVAAAVPRKLARKLAAGFEPVRWEDLDVDWSRTQAFNDSDWGYIYLNVKGREPQGIVPPRACDRLRAEIIAGLGGLVDPETRRPLGVRARAKEEVYAGKHLEEAPDLVVETDEGAPAFMSKVGYATCVARERWGSHRRDGILLAWGPDISPGSIDAPVDMADVAPTTLHLLGVPIPEDMTGQVRLDMMTDRAAEKPVLRGPSLRPPRRHTHPLNETDLARRLRAVGYLE